MVFGLQIVGNIVAQSLSLSQVLGEGIATEPNTTISTILMLSSQVSGFCSSRFAATSSWAYG